MISLDRITESEEVIISAPKYLTLESAYESTEDLATSFALSTHTFRVHTDASVSFQCRQLVDSEDFGHVRDDDNEVSWDQS